jgi:hypothetical protein
VGFHIDDIELTHTFEVLGPEITAIGNSGSFQFQTEVAGDHLLLVRGIGWLGFPALEWGAAFRLRVD